MKTHYWDWDKKVVLTELVHKHTKANTPEEFRQLSEDEYAPALREMISLYPGLQYSRMIRNFERLCRDKEIKGIFDEAFVENIKLTVNDIEIVNDHFEKIAAKGTDNIEAEKYRLIETVTDLMHGITEDINLKYAGQQTNIEKKEKMLALLNAIYESD